MGFFDWFRKPKPEPVSDEEAFVRDIEARARALPGVLKVSRDPKAPLGLLVETAGGQQTAWLGNLFLETRALDGATRERQIARHLESWGQAAREVTWAEAQANLAVSLRGPLGEVPPMLIMHGRRDFLVPPSASVKMHLRFPGSKLMLLEHCGHCPQLDDPALVAEAVAELAGRAAAPAGQGHDPAATG